METAAQDRGRWSQVTTGLCSTDNDKSIHSHNDKLSLNSITEKYHCLPRQPVKWLDSNRILVDGFSQREFLVIISQQPDDTRKVLAWLVLVLVTTRVQEARDRINAGLYVSVQRKHRQSIPQGQHCSKIMKPPQSLPLQMAEHLLRAQPDSVANHVTAHSIGDWRALTWLATSDWLNST